eukprot:TRINITY_DN653_c0_g1_i3.p1 TRINITY_DN653_c0_g1~~TRINITY_DN653_c0_g1_i3.p1  ORF type:complete len:192 (-),score=66.74 TRINITY_DN653_c0_g1_i3:26-601(-)
MSEEYKCVILGGGGVGKSALSIQFVCNHFVEEYDPTIEDSYRKQTVVDDIACTINIIDTAGQEEYSAMRSQYMREGQGFVLAYSITSRSSFLELSAIYDQIVMAKDGEKVPIAIVANKCDQESERQVSRAEGELFAQARGATFCQVSAKNRTNIEEPFFQVVRDIRKERQPTKVAQKKSKTTKVRAKCSVM